MFSINSCVSKVSQTVLDKVLNTPGSQVIWMERTSLSKIVENCQYPWFWLLTLGSPDAHNIDLTSEFLLGTEIAHYKEENETLISSISWNTLLVMATYKKSVTSEHPVYHQKYKNPPKKLCDKSQNVHGLLSYFQ